MLFNSGHFFFFFFVFYLLYLASLKNVRVQNLLTLAASYFFYGFWDYRFLALIMISTAVDFIAAQRIEYSRDNGDRIKARRWLWLSVTVNLGILGFFKYFNFFVGSFAELLGTFGLDTPRYTLEIILPVGISFYTFQTMSYTIDVYRGRQKATTHALNFALYVSFFPQLMAGPIERAKKLLPQLEKARTIDFEDIREGGWLLLWGVFKKVYIADNLAPFTYGVIREGGAASALDLYLAAIAFTLQLYCDFSGYSDMARGMARMMGIKLSLNFNLPFFSSNPSEMWRRWHITLAEWFRNYVYDELRKLNQSPAWLAVCVLLTMMLVGLWHGGDWAYVVWGGLWGVAMVTHRIVTPVIVRVSETFPRLNGALHWSGVLVTFHISLSTGIFFVSPNLPHAAGIAQSLFTGFDSSATSVSDAARVLFYVWPLLLVQTVQHSLQRLDFLAKAPSILRMLIYIVLLLLLWTNGADQLNEFIYFQF